MRGRREGCEEKEEVTHATERTERTEGTERRRRTWKELTPGRKAAMVVTGVVQLGLASAAWTDLARRPADQVRGPKWRWAMVIAVNWVGPILYFTRGRRPG